MVTIEQVKILAAVAESQSMREAAERVFKTQPALTQAIQQLESQLEVTLFDRSGYRLQLTNQGRVIHQKAQVLLNAQQDLLQSASHFSAGREDKISLAIEASFELEIALPGLELTQRHFPNTQIVLMQEYLSGAIEQLTNEEVELAIAAVLPDFTNVGELELKSIGVGQMINVATPKLINRHPGLSQVNELINEYQVVVKDTGSATKGRNVGVQQAQRYWYVNDFSTKRSLIKSGMGWGRLPEHVIRQDLVDGSLVPLELKNFHGTINVEYYLAKLHRKQLGPVASYMWDNLVS